MVLSDEEAALVAASEHYRTIIVQAIIILMLHTGLRTMEVCDLCPGDISIESIDESHLTI